MVTTLSRGASYTSYMICHALEDFIIKLVSFLNPGQTRCCMQSADLCHCKEGAIEPLTSVVDIKLLLWCLEGFILNLLLWRHWAALLGINTTNSFFKALHVSRTQHTHQVTASAPSVHCTCISWWTLHIYIRSTVTASPRERNLHVKRLVNVANRQRWRVPSSTTGC